jgi:hypothetical protein
MIDLEAEMATGRLFHFKKSPFPPSAFGAWQR